MKAGLPWYKREPTAYLGGVQGLSSKEHAVYSVVLDLIYAHGGEINNDPKWIAGWISDMGAAAVRKALSALDEKGKILLTETKISEKRAKNEAKTKEKLTETARKTGEKGGKKSAELRARSNKNNDIGQGYPSNEIQADKTREDKSKYSQSDDPPDPPPDPADLWAEKIWKNRDVYPHPANKGGKAATIKKLTKLTEDERRQFEAWCVGYRNILARENWQNPAMLATTLNQERWREEIDLTTSAPPDGQPQRDFSKY